MHKNNKILALIFIFFIPFFSYAQNKIIEQDFGIWLGVLIKKDLIKKFELTLEQQVRTCKNTTKIDTYFAELGFNYTINKNFKLNSNFRYVHDQKKWKNPENSLRYNLDILFKIKINKKFRLGYRARYQQKFIGFFDDHATIINRNKITLRNKIKLKFNYNKKHHFYFSTDFFITSSAFKEASLNKIRFMIGDKIKTKIGKFNIGFGYALNFHHHHPPSSFIFLKGIYIINL